MLNSSCPTMGRTACLPSGSTQQQRHNNRHRGQLQVMGALSRTRKEETVELLVEKMQTSSVVFGMRFKGLDVKTLQAIRKEMPADVLVCKNTLMRIAADRVEGFSPLKEATKEDKIAESVKVYLDFEKKLSAGLSKEAKEAGQTATSISGACMDGKFVTPEEFKKLEKMPTKQELIATIARLIKQVPTKVAVGINQVPTKMAYGIKALADADDNKEALVGDVCKPKAAAEGA